MYDSILEAKRDPMDVMMKMEHNLQITLSDKFSNVLDPKQLDTVGEVLDYIQEMKVYVDDEYREVYTALGGSNNPDANAVWKPWKKNNEALRNVRMSELSEADKLEIKKEMVDVFHFVLLQMIALGFSGEELFNIFHSKNQENFIRQLTGY